MSGRQSLEIRRAAGGWRLDKLKSRDNIDALVALAMAVESAESPTPAMELLGWL